MEITLNNRKIKLVEPEHIDKRFLQEAKFAIKNLPNAFASTEIFMGFGASVASLFVPDMTSRIVLSSIAAAALFTGISTNALKTYYNNPENDYLFETEFRAYIENFTKKRFKQLTKLEKAKKNSDKNKIKELENVQRYLIQDTAEVLLNYLSSINECFEEIYKLKEQEKAENQYKGEDYIKDIKCDFAKLRIPYDRDKFYLLKVIGENLDLFEYCKFNTKVEISNSVIGDYELYLVNDVALKDYENSQSLDENIKTILASYNKLDMEERAQDGQIFEELGMPCEYSYFTSNKDLRDIVDRNTKFIKDLDLEQGTIKAIEEIVDDFDFDPNDVQEDIADWNDNDEKLQ